MPAPPIRTRRPQFQGTEVSESLRGRLFPTIPPFRLEPRYHGVQRSAAFIRHMLL
jgi:hypothetical protein